MIGFSITNSWRRGERVFVIRESAGVLYLKYINLLLPNPQINIFDGHRP